MLKFQSVDWLTFRNKLKMSFIKFLSALRNHYFASLIAWVKQFQELNILEYFRWTSRYMAMTQTKLIKNQTQQECPEMEAKWLKNHNEREKKNLRITESMRFHRCSWKIQSSHHWKVIPFSFVTIPWNPVHDTHT